MVWAEITLVTDNCHAHPDDEIVRCYFFQLFVPFSFYLMAISYYHVVSFAY